MNKAEYNNVAVVTVLIAGTLWSFGALVVRFIENAQSVPWQYLFFRGFTIFILINIYLFIKEGKSFIKNYKKIGASGILGGISLGIAMMCFIWSITHTTAAITLLMLAAMPFMTAILGYIFLKEKISKLTLFSIILAFIGIMLMVGNSLSPGQTSGNIAAFIMPISFATLILIVRKFPDIDMIPMQFVAGIGAIIVGYLFSTKLIISSHDIFLGFLAGFFQVGLGFIFITIGARSTPSALVGIIMLTEAVLGPLWAWLFANENPPLVVLYGGVIIISAVLLQFFNRKIIN